MNNAAMAEALARRVRAAAGKHNNDALPVTDVVLHMSERIAELEQEIQRWLEWSESKGPGLEAYREMGQRIEQLESWKTSARKALDVREQRIAELERESAQAARNFRLAAEDLGNATGRIAELKKAIEKREQLMAALVLLHDHPADYDAERHTQVQAMRDVVAKMREVLK